MTAPVWSLIRADRLPPVLSLPPESVGPVVDLDAALTDPEEPS